MTPRVLVVGGTGYFGRILAEDLLRWTELDVVIGSRRLARARTFAAELGARATAVEVDLDDSGSLRRALEGTFAAVCAAGPFQRLPLSLLDACLERSVHYFDLSDDRGFTGRARTRAAAAGASVAVCSGWSAAPALTAVLARIAVSGFECVDRLDGQIAPGNRAPRREGTVASLLHSAGRPFRLWDGGKWRDASGWSEPRMFSFPMPVGDRRGYLVDVPDHEIFPGLFGVRSAAFRAGAELGPLNAGMSVLAAAARAGLVSDWARWSAPLRAAMAFTAPLGHDWGAVGVEAEGRSAGRAARVRACVTAAHEGQRIPALPVSVTVAALAAGRLEPRAATLDAWTSREGLSAECGRRGWKLTVEEA